LTNGGKAAASVAAGPQPDTASVKENTAQTDAPRSKQMVDMGQLSNVLVQH
jgi:hypothetical protein